jgi:diguanylate cyclase
MTAAADEKATDKAFALAQKVLTAMRQHGSPAYPRSFEVWHAYLGDESTTLTRDLSAIIDKAGTVDGRMIDTLYETHLASGRFIRQAERSSLGVLNEIDSVMSMIDKTIGSSGDYDASLKALSADLKSTADRSRIREIIEAMVVATCDAVMSNQKLEKRLSEGRAEINSLRHALEVTRADALTDPLTGLANRRHFEEMLQKSIDQTTITHEPFCLVMCDIDFFKRFNDQYGHMTGDQVLRLVAMTMKQKFKTTAIPCRYGGEEFAIIMPASDLVAGRLGAETLRQALLTRELVIRSTGETIGRVTISLGVGVYQIGDTAASIIERADACLMEAKRQGRNRTVIENCAEPDSKVA